MTDILRRRNLPALAAIVGVTGAVAAAFVVTAGWLSPGALTQAAVVDQFQRTNGLHPGFRRNHPKGVCFTGWFESDGAGQRISKAALFAPGRTPVFGRFAIAGGQPYAPDMPSSVHSMALNFALADGEIWRMGMNGIPVFTAASTQDLYDGLVATTPDPATGKPDPAKLKAYIARHPATARATAIVRNTPLASGFANTTYNSLDAFLFVNASGAVTKVRWAMAANDKFEAAKPGAAPQADPNFEFNELAARIQRGPITYQFVATLGQTSDETRDPTQAWPADRETLPLGQLTIDRLEDEAHGACRDVTFDPLILPAGVRPSDDPILSARSAAYAVSFRRRAGEAPPVSAIRFPSGSEGAR